MANEPLATAADLSARGHACHQMLVDKALAVASAAVREAAGAHISEVTATITTEAPQGRLLRLPAPVTAVASVMVDGSLVTDYIRIGNGLYRRCGWGCDPVPVVVEFTHGLATVPEDIIDLVCDLAVAWMDHQESGGGSTAGLASVSVDDVSETYTDESAGQVSPVSIPRMTRELLASRFGGGVAVLETL